MKQSIGWKKIVLGVVLAAVLIFGIWFYRFWYVDQGLENRKYVPEEARLLVQLNGKQFIQTGIKALFSGEEDPAFEKQWDEFVQKQKQNGGFGIDLNQTVYLFQTQVAKASVWGLIAVVDDEAWFESSLNQFPHVGYALSDGTAVILFSTEGSKQHWSKVASQMLSTPNKNVGKSIPNTMLVEARQWQLENRKIYVSTPFTLTVEPSEIRLSGSATVDRSILPHNLKHRLQPQNAHISSVIPAAVQDSIRILLGKRSIHLPRIDYAAINYAKLSVEEVDSRAGILFNPDCQVLLHFTEPIQIDSLFASDATWQELGRYENKQLYRGTAVYHVISPDPYTLFIGTDPKALQAEAPSAVFSLEGNLVNFTTIEGGGMITMLASVYPPFRAFRGLTQELSLVNIRLEERRKTLSLHGQIRTKARTNIFKESLKFYWQLGN